MGFRRIIPRVALDVTLWYVIPAVFMLLYVGQHLERGSSVLPHAIVVTIPLLSLFIVRIVLSRQIGSVAVNRLLTTLITATLLASLVLYYSIVLVGLHSWGGVVALNVVPTFFAQASVLTDTLHISLLFVALLLAICFVGLIFACWVYLKHFDWTQELTQRISGWTIAALVFFGSGIVAVETYRFTVGSWTASAEPLSLTLFPQSGTLDLEGYSINPLTASTFDHLEDAERKSYTPTAIRRRNLVVILVDALRPDHMRLYGYGRDTTPNLARITSEHPTRVITDVHSSCADTICAMFSLFSARFPREFSFHPFTLQEVLRLNGYRIHMILSGDHTFFHSLKGFYGHVDSFYDGTQAHGYFLNDDRLVVDRVAHLPEWNGVPIMFQFHLMSAHILRKPAAEPGKFQPAVRYVLHDSRDIGAGGQALPSAVNFYDNGVLNADGIIGELLQTLQLKRYLEDALVVITADHGESLGEHGLFHHANSVREEVLRIPFVLISYGYQPDVVDRQRGFPSQVDIAPTILAEFGMPIPGTWSGRPVQDPHGLAFSFFEEHSFAGLIDHRDPLHAWKYWIDRRTAQDHVFDLSSDPHEEHDLRGTFPRESVIDWRARSLDHPSVEMAGR
jgi:glucan phosphoethanolaminetransferase (alkaline phosphatase superfamily)